MEADALSRLPMMTNEDGIEIMSNYPPLDPYNPILNKNPLDLAFIQTHQQQDAALMKALKEDKRISVLELYDNKGITFSKDTSQQKSIVIPRVLQFSTIRWLHSLLDHAGINRLYNTLNTHFWFPHMLQMITDYVKGCTYCQRYNKQTKKYGKLPPKQVRHLNPWDEVCVDMI